MRPFVLAVVAALALAPAAGAKEIKQAKVCGADGCTTTNDHGVAAALANGGAPRTPPAAAPFYTLRIVVDTGGGHTDGFELNACPSGARSRPPTSPGWRCRRRPPPRSRSSPKVTGHSRPAT